MIRPLYNENKCINNKIQIAPKPVNHLQQQQKAPKKSAASLQQRHPAPLPCPTNQASNSNWRQIPPRPNIRINNSESGVIISWDMQDLNESHAEIMSYQIFAYQETSAVPSTDTWRHVGDVKAMILPMAVTLSQFQEGQRFYFAVRAVDEHVRYGVFSAPCASS